jgi:glycine/D-amino acid oxidase-like deaminating enzyme
MNPTFNVILIGAGIMGASSAFQLAARGLRVGVLEKKAVGG